MNMNRKRFQDALLRRMPELIQRPLLLRQQRQEQKQIDRNYILQDADLHALKSCDSRSKQFRFAEDKFGIFQNESEFTGLLDLLATHRPTVSCEIGSCKCGSLFLLTHGVHSLEKVVAIDLIFRQRAMFMAMKRQDQQVRFIENYSTAKRTRRLLEQFLNGDKLDFLFIDGDHSYEGSKADFLLYKDYVREGGLIAFHDIVPDITTQKGSPVMLSKSTAGEVYLLWKELKKQYKHYEFVEDWKQDGQGIGVIEHTSTLDLLP